jgi:AcrR family transcriptional regulator
MNDLFIQSIMPRTEEANQLIRESSRKKILDAAMRVYARRGKESTMAEVAEEAGVSQGLAYRYFPSKDAIFVALLRQMSRPPDEIDSMVRNVPGSPAERLARIVSAMVERRRKDPEFYQFFNQAMSDDSLPPDIMEQMKTQGPLVHKILRRLIAEGQAAGEIAKDNPDKLVRAVIACLDGLSRMELLSSKQLEREMPDASIILRMLRPEARRE